MDVVEQLGSGIKRILDLSREYGVPEPVIEADNNWVTVTFPRDPTKAGMLEKILGPGQGSRVGGRVRKRAADLYERFPFYAITFKILRVHLRF
jgi:hypothetical protein